ncbi:HypC/HybG/HupF family hydrogenase formation chaperone [Planctomycetota bacterium]
MCLAIPVKVIEIKDTIGVVDIGGLKKECRLDLLDDVKVGDYVLLHAGFAIQKLDTESAEESLKLFKEIESKT